VRILIRIRIRRFVQREKLPMVCSQPALQEEQDTVEWLLLKMNTQAVSAFYSLNFRLGAGLRR
jgi:hypothetical protein